MLRACVFLPPVACLIIGGILIAFGVHVHENYATNSTGYTCSYAFICLGIIPYLFFIFLCIGYTFKNSCCIITFIIFQILGFIGQIVIAYLLGHSDVTLSLNLGNTIDASWEQEIKNAGAMSIYESTFSCCGRASPNDYVTLNRLPPKSCFLNGVHNAPENLFGNGCRIVFESHILKLLKIYTALSWVLIVLESFVICLACVFVR